MKNVRIFSILSVVIAFILTSCNIEALRGSSIVDHSSSNDSQEDTSSFSGTSSSGESNSSSSSSSSFSSASSSSSSSSSEDTPIDPLDGYVPIETFSKRMPAEFEQCAMVKMCYPNNMPLKAYKTIANDNKILLLEILVVMVLRA